jgi:hypothetical protein
MEKNPSWIAESHSADEKTSPPSVKPKYHWRVQKIQPLDPLLGQLDPVHSLTIYF